STTPPATSPMLAATIGSIRRNPIDPVRRTRLCPAMSLLVRVCSVRVADFAAVPLPRIGLPPHDVPDWATTGSPWVSPHRNPRHLRRTARFRRRLGLPDRPWGPARPPASAGQLRAEPGGFRLRPG